MIFQLSTSKHRIIQETYIYVKYLLIRFSHFLLFIATNMDTNSTSTRPKPRLSSDDLSNIAFGVAILTIMFLLFCFFYALCKIYSDEETNEETNVRIRLKRRQKQSLRTPRSNSKLGSESEVMVPDNTPIGFSDGTNYQYIIVFSQRK